MVQRVGVGERQLQRLLRGRVIVPVAHPHQRLASQDGRRALALGGGDQRQVERVLAQLRQQPRRGGAHHLHEHLRMPAREAAQDVRQEGGRVVVGAAEAQRAGEARAGDVGHRRVVVAQEGARMAQQALAVQRERDAAAGAVEQRLAQQGLELLHLHAHRRLRAADARGRATQRARLGDGHEGAQQVDVEGAAHGVSTSDSSVQKY
ncbi:hypothetical protein X551_03794 [Methylibium sp. T29]|nr:hypothetical protein X551_03794 [Methylibium sp. T29]